MMKDYLFVKIHKNAVPRLRNTVLEYQVTHLRVVCYRQLIDGEFDKFDLTEVYLCSDFACINTSGNCCEDVTIMKKISQIFYALNCFHLLWCNIFDPGQFCYTSYYRITPISVLEYPRHAVKEGIAVAC